MGNAQHFAAFHPHDQIIALTRVRRDSIRRHVKHQTTGLIQMNYTV
ncbi:hypothetical protein [uncultured Xanthomonas sp.]|nr:hypothetical protein [uncultured Xanthomonas sp.]